MDNFFFRFFLQTWPVIVATIATVIIIYYWLRPKVTAEQLQKGIVRQNILTIVETILPQDVIDPEISNWLEVREHIIKGMVTHQLSSTPPNQKIAYKKYICLSLLWILFWSATSTFILIRIIVNPYLYNNEAIFLGYFLYYIILGLIAFFRR